MISNQILQNTIEGLKGITRIDFCVMDTDGKPLASTMTEQENYEEEVPLWILRQIARLCVDISFLRSLKNISWNMCCWRMVAVMMCTWLERLQHFRSRIC